MTIFTHNQSNIDIAQQNMVFQKLIRIFPLVSIDFEVAERTKDKRSLKLPALSYPRSSTLNIILHNQDKDNQYFEKAEKFIGLFSNLAPLSPRPKCLAVFFTRYNITEGNLHKILLHVWTMQFFRFFHSSCTKQ